MSCEDEVSRISFIKNLPEVINVDLSDRFVIESVTEGTKTITFEDFNLNIENALFEEEFLYHTTATNQLCSMMSNGGSILNTSNNIKQYLNDEITQLNSVTSLLLSASAYQTMIDDVYSVVNPDGLGVIESLSIVEEIKVGELTSVFRSTDKYVINETRTSENYLNVTELAPERDWKSGDLNPQSLGVYVEVVNNQIILTPTPKALGKAVDSITVTISGVELNSKEDYIVDIVRVEEALFSSLVVNGDLDNEQLLDILDFSYNVNKSNGTITISYNHTADTTGNLILNSNVVNSDIFEIRLYSIFGEEVVANDSGSSGSGSAFDITAANGDYTVAASTGGTGYSSGDKITISGDNLGGSSPANDVTVTVTQINANGSIATLSSSGGSTGSGTYNNITGVNNITANVGPSDPVRDIDLYPLAKGVNKTAGKLNWRNSIAITDIGDLIAAVATRESPYEVSLFKVSDSSSLVEVGFIEVGSPITDISMRKNKLVIGMAGSNRASIYTRSGDMFNFTKELKYGNRFGTSVYLDGNEEYIAVGSRPTDTRSYGSVGKYSVATGRLIDGIIEENKSYVSALTGDLNNLVDIEYDKQIYGSINNSNVGYGFGSAVCISNNMIIIGGGTGDGSVCAFKWSEDNNRWEEVFRQTGSVGSGYGSDVCINSTGDKMIIASSKENNGDGTARAYSWSGSSWSEVGIYTPAAGSKGGIDQVSISADGTKVAVGERLTTTDEGTGRICVFNYPFNNKKELITNSKQSQLGPVDLSIDGTYISAAAPGNNNVLLYKNL